MTKNFNSTTVVRCGVLHWQYCPIYRVWLGIMWNCCSVWRHRHTSSRHVGVRPTLINQFINPLSIRAHITAYWQCTYRSIYESRQWIFVRHSARQIISQLHDRTVDAQLMRCRCVIYDQINLKTASAIKNLAAFTDCYNFLGKIFSCGASDSDYIETRFSVA